MVRRLMFFLLFFCLLIGLGFSTSIAVQDPVSYVNNTCRATGNTSVVLGDVYSASVGNESVDRVFCSNFTSYSYSVNYSNVDGGIDSRVGVDGLEDESDRRVFNFFEFVIGVSLLGYLVYRRLLGSGSLGEAGARDFSERDVVLRVLFTGFTGFLVFSVFNFVVFSKLGWPLPFYREQTLCRLVNALGSGGVDRCTVNRVYKPFFFVLDIGFWFLVAFILEKSRFEFDV